MSSLAARLFFKHPLCQLLAHVVVCLWDVPKPTSLGDPLIPAFLHTLSFGASVHY